MNDSDSRINTASATGLNHREKRRRRHPRLRFVALLLAILMVVPGVSYARALTYPGNASWQERSVEWVRDNGGSPLVNTVENWYYTRNTPPATPPDLTAPHAQKPTKAAGTNAAILLPATARPTDIPPLAGANPLPGEGTWTVQSTGAAGTPILYSTIVRPDPAYPGVVAAAAWVPADTTNAHLVAGTRQPGGTGWGGDAAIPASDRSSLVATFNSGWKYKDMDGGFYANKQANPPLKDGLASVIIDKQGQVSVGQWGRDASLGPDIAAVRQNLHLVIDKGAPVSGLDSNADGLWGSAKNQLQYTWRSGLGTDAAGNLVYVAGDDLTLQTLATAMTESGIQIGMELDIHPKMVNFAVYDHPTTGQNTATNLLPGMAAAPERYVDADQRDFFYLTLP